MKLSWKIKTSSTGAGYGDEQRDDEKSAVLAVVDGVATDDIDGNATHFRTTSP